jgi:spermidine synthase
MVFKEHRRMGDKPVNAALKDSFGRLMSRIVVKEKEEAGSALRVSGSEARKQASVGIVGVSTKATTIREWSRGVTAPVISRRACVSLTMLIYFVSGACSLIDEVVWVRLLKLTLGNTVRASSIVVSTFMAGLAIGALIMGRYSDRIRHRLRVYSLLEGSIAIAALSLPWALKLVDGAYVWFYRAYHPTPAQLLTVQILLSSAILLVPSMLMGSTLPLLGRFVTSLERETGRLVGKLYSLNTFGAAVGCLLAGFALIRFLGVMGTLYAAAALNLLVALAGWLLSHTATTELKERAEEKPVKSIKQLTAGMIESKFCLLILAFFLSGMIGIGYELLWMRSIIHLLAGSTYVFSSVLTIYLLGNVIGAGIGSGLVKQLKNPAIGFAVTLFLLGLCGVLYLPLLLLWTSDVLPHVDREVELARAFIPLSTHAVKPLVQSAFLFLVPAVIMGVGFPIALQAWAVHVHKVGRTTGTAYAVNTAGAVAGGIVTEFALVPLLGLQLTISCLGLAGLWVAAAVCLVFISGRKLGGWLVLPMLAGILTVATIAGPSDLFEAVVKSNPRLAKRLRLIAVEEGVNTTVSLYRHAEEGTLYLHTSGQRVAGDTYFWRSDQKMLGHFGILLNSQARKVLSVGFGSGESTACMAMHDLERADCAEIAPEVVDVSLRFFEHINLGDRLNDEINMIYMDAKNYIHLTDIKYDAIVNDSIHPRQFAENASLYTKEYFESAREHLNEKGLFMTWIPTHHVEPISVINSIIGTMMEVFPYVTVWYMTPSPAMYLLVVGSEQPQYFSPYHIENELARDSVRDSLSLVDINNSLDVMSCYLGDQEDLKRCIRTYSANSDYRPFIEFTTETAPGGSGAFERFVRELNGDSLYRHIDWAGFSGDQRREWLVSCEQLRSASAYLLRSVGTKNRLERLKLSMEGLRIVPGNPALLSVARRAEEYLYSLCRQMIESDGAAGALSTAKKMLDIHPGSAVAWTIRSDALEEKGNVQGALDAADMAVQLASEPQRTFHRE